MSRGDRPRGRDVEAALARVRADHGSCTHSRPTRGPLAGCVQRGADVEGVLALAARQELHAAGERGPPPLPSSTVVRRMLRSVRPPASPGRWRWRRPSRLGTCSASGEARPSGSEGQVVTGPVADGAGSSRHIDAPRCSDPCPSRAGVPQRSSGSPASSHHNEPLNLLDSAARPTNASAVRSCAHSCWAMGPSVRKWTLTSLSRPSCCTEARTATSDARSNNVFP